MLVWYCQVALDINRIVKGNEWFGLLKGSKGLEMILEFCYLNDDSELSKYLSITSQAINIHLKCRHNFTSKRWLEQGSKIVDELETCNQNCSVHQFPYLISSIIVFSIVILLLLIFTILRIVQSKMLQQLKWKRKCWKVQRMDGCLGLEVKSRLSLCSEICLLLMQFIT